MPTAYSDVADLLIGDMQLGSMLDPQKAIDDAYAEMNIRIGMVYEMPLPMSLLSDNNKNLLRLINNRLASGRLIMAAATGGEAQKVHAYGQSLVEMAFCDLALILEGTIPLDGATRSTDTDRSSIPTITSHDAVFATEVFEAFAYADPWAPPPLVDPGWRPG